MQSSGRRSLPVAALSLLMGMGSLFMALGVSAQNASPEASPMATPMASPVAAEGTIVSDLSCWNEEPNRDSGYPQWSSEPAMTIDPAKSYTATIETNRGTIVVDLYADRAPNAVNNFVCLATEGYYDGVIFHRVMTGFMIQTGDPTGTGQGGPGYQFLDELPGEDLNYDRGVLSMANAGPNTNGSQFFINHANNTANLQKNYTIFGKVADEESMATVDTIAAVPVQPSAAGEPSSPFVTITILSVTITEQ